MDVLNYVNGQWIKPDAPEYFDVINPATGELIARTPLCGIDEIAAAAQAACPPSPGAPVGFSKEMEREIKPVSRR